MVNTSRSETTSHDENERLMAATIYTTTHSSTHTGSPALDLAGTATRAADRIRIATRTKNTLRTLVAYPLLAIAGLGLATGALAENTATTAQLTNTTPAATQTTTDTPTAVGDLTLTSTTGR